MRTLLLPIVMLVSLGACGGKVRASGAVGPASPPGVDAGGIDAGPPPAVPTVDATVAPPPPPVLSSDRCYFGTSPPGTCVVGPCSIPNFAVASPTCTAPGYVNFVINGSVYGVALGASAAPGAIAMFYPDAGAFPQCATGSPSPVEPPSGAGGYAATGVAVGTDGGAPLQCPAPRCMPAPVTTFLARKCTVCHGDPPLPTALAGLVTSADLLAPSRLDRTWTEAQESVALMALISATAMPPGTGDQADIPALQSWINAAYPTTQCAPTPCLPAPVAALLSTKCTVCHGDPPLPTALAGLVTVADLLAPSKLDPTMNEAQESVALMQVTMGVTAMPPPHRQSGRRRRHAAELDQRRLPGRDVRALITGNRTRCHARSG